MVTSGMREEPRVLPPGLHFSLLQAAEEPSSHQFSARCLQEKKA